MDNRDWLGLRPRFSSTLFGIRPHNRLVHYHSICKNNLCKNILHIPNTLLFYLFTWSILLQYKQSIVIKQMVDRFLTKRMPMCMFADCIQRQIETSQSIANKCATRPIDTLRLQHTMVKLMGKAASRTLVLGKSGQRPR